MIWNNEVWSHLLVTFVYFFIVSVLRLVTGGVVLGWLGVLGILEMWGGALVGVFLLDIDHLFYWWYLHPEKEDSTQAKGIWNQKNLKLKEKARKLFELLQKYHQTHNRLMFHSAISQIVLLLLAFYLLTSGGNIFGSALIMSVNLHLLKDEWVDFLKNKDHLKDWLFWQVRETGLMVYVREYLAVVSAIFLLLTILLVRG